MVSILKIGDKILAGDFMSGRASIFTVFQQKDLDGCCDRVKFDYPIIYRNI